MSISWYSWESWESEKFKFSPQGHKSKQRYRKFGATVERKIRWRLPNLKNVHDFLGPLESLRWVSEKFQFFAQVHKYKQRYRKFGATVERKIRWRLPNLKNIYDFLGPLETLALGVWKIQIFCPSAQVQYKQGSRKSSENEVFSDYRGQ